MWNLRSLVNLAQHGISRLGDNRCSKPSNKTTSQVNSRGHPIAHSVLIPDLVRRLGNPLVHHELGHGVRDLLEQDRPKPGVECADSFLRGNLGHSAEETSGEGRLGDETDTCGFEGAEGDIGEEFGESGGEEVDGGAVVRGGFEAL